jgi:tripartite-type tricarboxylate transporter receptor subunit TctC
MMTLVARSLVARWLLAAFALVVTTGVSGAEDFPSRAVRILVPYSAGGTSDTAARLVADPLSRQLGQPVYIENRGGGGGLNATEAFFALPPDGYTPTRPVSYSVERGVLPLGTIWRSPQLFAVSPKLGASTMAEFLTRAKAKPGTLTVGSAGVGALTHLSLELLKREAKIDLVHVPFRSTGGTLPALIGSQIDASFGDVALLSSYARAGNINALALAAAQRSPLLPELITMAEAGLPGIEAENWYGLVVSTRTPPAVVERLKAGLLAAQNDPAYRDSLAKQGTSAGEPGAESFDRLIRQEIVKWKPIVTAPGFKIE